MTVDMEQLKKSAILLKEIFDEVFQARLDGTKINNPDSMDDGQELLSLSLIGEVAFDVHLFFVKTLEAHNWDLDKLFYAAANPVIDLSNGKDYAKLDPAYRQDGAWREEYQEWIIPKEQIEKRAQQALEKIEKLAGELKL